MDTNCRKIHGLQPGIAAGIDAGVGLQVHRHVQRDTVVSAVAADFDAEGGNFAQASEIGGSDCSTRWLVIAGLTRNPVFAWRWIPDLVRDDNLHVRDDNFHVRDDKSRFKVRVRYRPIQETLNDGAGACAVTE